MKECEQKDKKEKKEVSGCCGKGVEYIKVNKDHINVDETNLHMKVCSGCGQELE